MKAISKMNIIIASITLLMIIAISCKKATPTTYDCTGIAPTYTADVKPLMDNNCATSGCHSASAKASGKDYSSYTAVKSLATENAFMGSMQHLSGYDNMPKGGSKLSDAQLKTISCWIQNGMIQ
jgi:hypothetical protein